MIIGKPMLLRSVKTVVEDISYIFTYKFNISILWVHSFKYLFLSLYYFFVMKNNCIVYILRSGIVIRNTKFQCCLRRSTQSLRVGQVPKSVNWGQWSRYSLLDRFRAGWRSLTIPRAHVAQSYLMSFLDIHICFE